MTAPQCPHLNAFKVDSSVIPGHVWRCWCPDCETELQANFKRPCCGTEPEMPHMYNCAGLVPSPPRLADPHWQPAVAYRPPRRRIPAALFPILATGLIFGVIMALALRPHHPEAYSPADAQVCSTWFAQGVHAPEGSGVSYIGGWEDPGYAKLTAAEDALDAQAGVNPGLSEAVTQWEADMESSYVIQHGNWGFENIGSDKAAVTGWCKSNRYKP